MKFQTFYGVPDNQFLWDCLVFCFFVEGIVEPFFVLGMSFGGRAQRVECVEVSCVSDHPASGVGEPEVGREEHVLIDKTFCKPQVLNGLSAIEAHTGRGEPVLVAWHLRRLRYTVLHALVTRLYVINSVYGVQVCLTPIGFECVIGIEESDIFSFRMADGEVARR